MPAHELDLRQFASWCQQHQLHLFGARRADIEFFARDLEARGRSRATITRRLCTVAGLYRYAVEEELLDHSPAAHVRRPRRSGPSGDFGPELTEEASVVGPHELLDEPSAVIEPEHAHEVPDDPCSVRLELPRG